MPKNVVYSRLLFICSDCACIARRASSQGKLLPDGFTKARKNSINLNFSNVWNSFCSGFYLHFVHHFFPLFFVRFAVKQQKKELIRCSSSCSLTICLEFIRSESFRHCTIFVIANSYTPQAHTQLNSIKIKIFSTGERESHHHKVIKL